MGQIEKIFVLTWMIVGNILFPQVFKFPVWVSYNNKLYFSLEWEDIDNRRHKKSFNVAYGHYYKSSDKVPTLLMETSSWSKRIAYIKMNLNLIKRGDISLRNGFI